MPRACLTDIEFEELIAGGLPAENEAEYKRHIERCMLCRGQWEELRVDEEMFKDLRAVWKESGLAPRESPGG
jgi:hypothetical protein